MVLKTTVQKQSSKQSLPKVSSEAFFKLNFLKNIYNRKTPVLGSLSNRVTSLKAGNFIKRDSNQVFSCKYCEIFKKSFFYRTPPVAAVFVSLMK